MARAMRKSLFLVLLQQFVVLTLSDLFHAFLEVQALLEAANLDFEFGFLLLMLPLAILKF